jgi:hypothetical protein
MLDTQPTPHNPVDTVRALRKPLAIEQLFFRNAYNCGQHFSGLKEWANPASKIGPGE